MTTDIALAAEGLVGQMERLTHRINNATAEEAKAAHDRLGMAREWAKMQENAAELAERLVWLEAVILRRIGQLDAKALPGAKRGAARHFATLDDAELSALLTDYPARSAVSAYNLWAKSEGIKSEHRRGRSMSVSHAPRDKVDDDEEMDESLRYAIDYRNLTVRQAAAVLLQEYAWTRPRGTVSDIVDAFIDDEAPMGDGASPLEASAFRAGLTEAVRASFASAPVETTERSWQMPAFITTYDDETGQWVRIPSEFAKVREAREMLAQRRGQIETLQRSYNNLERVLVALGVHECDPDEYLRNDTVALTRRNAQAARMTA